MLPATRQAVIKLSRRIEELCDGEAEAPQSIDAKAAGSKFFDQLSALVTPVMTGINSGTLPLSHEGRRRENKISAGTQQFGDDPERLLIVVNMLEYFAGDDEVVAILMRHGHEVACPQPETRIVRGSLPQNIDAVTRKIEQNTIGFRETPAEVETQVAHAGADLKEGPDIRGQPRRELLDQRQPHQIPRSGRYQRIEYGYLSCVRHRFIIHCP